MMNLLIPIGSGCITFLTINFITKRTCPSWFISFIEIIAYSFINTVCLIFLLSPLGRICVLTSENGLVVQYGESAILASLFLAFIIGIIFSWPDFRIKFEKSKEASGK